jgi:UDP-GlcNAc:undecaprenyl-phosphate GlcNAc-1-phosphate transferase
MDDRFGLDWKVRIAVEFAVAASVVYGLKLQLTAYIDLPWLTPILSIFWIVMLINSFNMLDNMDALSAGVAAIVSGMLALMLLSSPEPAQGQPQWFVAIMVLALLGGLLDLLAVLVHSGHEKNRLPAKPAMVGDGVGQDFLVGVADVGRAVRVVDGRGDEEGFAHDGSGSTLSFPPQERMRALAPAASASLIWWLRT